MPFSEIKVTGTLQKSGVLRLPKAVLGDGFGEVAIPGANATALSRVLRDVHGPYISTPRVLRRFVETPLRAEFVVRASEHSPDAVTLLPDGELRYVVEAYYNKSFSLAVPLTWIRGIAIRGWKDVTVSVVGERIRCSFPDRLYKSKGGQMLVIVPAPLVGSLQHKDKVMLTITPREPTIVGGVFVEDDQLWWGRADTATPRMIEREFAVPVSSWMSTKWKATTLITDDVAWLLGFYQAEGNKSVPMFSTPQKSPWLLRRVAHILNDAFQISFADMKMEVRYGGVVGKERAVDIYKACGVSITQIRPSTGSPGREHTHIATLEMRNSKPFAEAFQWGLRRIVTRQEELPRAARESFLHGFLDGDGTVTLASSTLLRVAASTNDERAYITSICDEVFERGSNGKVVEHVTNDQRLYERSLSVRDMLWLLRKGVFSEGTSRPRLFYRLHDVLDNPPPARGGDIRRGLTDREACAVELATYDAEWRYIKSIYPTVESITTGVKGLLYHYEPGCMLPRRA